MQCKVKHFRENTSSMYFTGIFGINLWPFGVFLKILSLALFCFLAFLSSHQKFWTVTAASLCSGAVEAQGAEVFGGWVQEEFWCVSAGFIGLHSISETFSKLYDSVRSCSGCLGLRWCSEEEPWTILCGQIVSWQVGQGDVGAVLSAEMFYVVKFRNIKVFYHL